MTTRDVTDAAMKDKSNLAPVSWSGRQLAVLRRLLANAPVVATSKR